MILTHLSLYYNQLKTVLKHTIKSKDQSTDSIIKHASETSLKTIKQYQKKKCKTSKQTNDVNIKCPKFPYSEMFT